MISELVKFRFADWDLKLQQTMVEIFPLKSEDAAYGKIKGMLSSLGDPFTRIISPKVITIGRYECPISNIIPGMIKSDNPLDFLIARLFL